MQAAHCRKKAASAAHLLSISAAVLFLFAVALLFIMPIVLTLSNSFMTESEIAANYGRIFTGITKSTKFTPLKKSSKHIPK